MATDAVKSGNQSYHRAKTWQMACFAGNTAAYCVYNTFIGYMAYFMYGSFGIATVAAGTLLTGFRLWDAVTDPILAWLLDRTDGKFGKFRPFMVCGDAVMAISCFLMFYVSYTLPQGLSFAVFLGFYLLYVLGFTAQGICSKGAQSCLTSDPKQRATYAMFDMVLFAVGMLGATMTITMVYAPKYPDFGVDFFKAV